MQPPILTNKVYDTSSVFTPENLLREARRQKSIPQGTIPAICILDPDGDIAQYLLSTNQAVVHPNWACYHTRLYTFMRDSNEYGNHSVCCWRIVCGSRRRRIIRIGLPVARQHDFGGPDCSHSTTAIFCVDRSGLARRGNQLSLPAIRLLQFPSPTIADAAGRRIRRFNCTCVKGRNLDN